VGLPPNCGLREINRYPRIIIRRAREIMVPIMYLRRIRTDLNIR